MELWAVLAPARKKSVKSRGRKSGDMQQQTDRIALLSMMTWSDREGKESCTMAGSKVNLNVSEEMSIVRRGRRTRCVNCMRKAEVRRNS